MLDDVLTSQTEGGGVVDFQTRYICFSHWTTMTRNRNLGTYSLNWNHSFLHYEFFKWRKVRVRLECSLHQNVERLMLLYGFILKQAA